MHRHVFYPSHPCSERPAIPVAERTAPLLLPHRCPFLPSPSHHRAVPATAPPFPLHGGSRPLSVSPSPFEGFVSVFSLAVTVSFLVHACSAWLVVPVWQALLLHHFSLSVCIWLRSHLFCLDHRALKSTSSSRSRSRLTLVAAADARSVPFLLVAPSDRKQGRVCSEPRPLPTAAFASVLSWLFRWKFLALSGQQALMLPLLCVLPPLFPISQSWFEICRTTTCHCRGVFAYHVVRLHHVTLWERRPRSSFTLALGTGTASVVWEGLALPGRIRLSCKFVSLSLRSSCPVPELSLLE